MFDEEEQTESELEDTEEVLQKFDEELKKDYILDLHPEIKIHNYNEINALAKVTRDANGHITDELHKTIPFLTKYERARILGNRAKQINCGADVFVDVPENIIDGYTIAEMEFKEKQIPYIIRRPLPSGGSEYWKFSDLEQIIY